MYFTTSGSSVVWSLGSWSASDGKRAFSLLYSLVGPGSPSGWHQNWVLGGFLTRVSGGCAPPPPFSDAYEPWGATRESEDRVYPLCFQSESLRLHSFNLRQSLRLLVWDKILVQSLRPHSVRLRSVSNKSNLVF